MTAFKSKFRRSKRMKIGIVGSRIWTDKKKIRDFIGLCMEEFGADLEIVSGGCKDGADRYAKECALSLGVKYVEFPPLHHPHNCYCPEPPYMYNQQYHVRYFFMRNKQIVEYSDKIVAFIPKGHVSNGTNNTLMWADKLKKPSVIIN